MTVKEYLRQLWCMDRTIDIKYRELEKLRAEIGIRQMPDNADRVTGSGYPQDHVADTVIQILQLQEKLNEALGRYIELKQKITEQIDGMENQAYKDILTCRYVLMMTWEDVAATMKYDRRYCFKIHGRALQVFYDQYLKEDTERHS